MFFPRLRRQAKWVFVFLALVFGAGFVFFGVGSSSSGIGDLLRGNLGFLGGGGSSGGPSVSKAQKRIAKNPKDAAAYHDLAKAYEAKKDDDAAIAALERYRALRPKDTAALQDLASLYSTKADDLALQTYYAQLDAYTQSGGPAAPSTASKIGQALATNPIGEALSAHANDLAAQKRAAYGKVESVYRSLAAANPDRADLQQELGLAAERAGDAQTAIAAYRTSLKLAPDDPTAPEIKRRIKACQSPFGCLLSR
jgi:tetratricopeptide (TPR) repeat protein